MAVKNRNLGWFLLRTKSTILYPNSPTVFLPAVRTPLVCRGAVLQEHILCSSCPSKGEQHSPVWYEPLKTRPVKERAPKGRGSGGTCMNHNWEGTTGPSLPKSYHAVRKRVKQGTGFENCTQELAHQEMLQLFWGERVDFWVARVKRWQEATLWDSQNCLKLL